MYHTWRRFLCHLFCFNTGKNMLSTEPISSSWVVTLIIDQMREALQHTSASTHTCTQTMTGVYSTLLTWRSATSQLKYRWAPKRWRRNLMRSPCNRTECLIWFFVFDDCVRGTGSVRRHWTGEGVKKETLSLSVTQHPCWESTLRTLGNKH